MTMTTLLVQQDNTSSRAYTPRELRDMLKAGKITWKSLVRVPGDADWLPLSTYQDMLREPQRSVVGVAAAEEAPAGGEFDLVKAGVVLAVLGLVLCFLLSPGMLEMLLIAAGLVLLVMGLCRK